MARGAPAQARYTKDQYFELVKKGAPPSDEDVARLLATIRRRVRRLLACRGLAIEDALEFDPLAEESPALAGIRGSRRHPHDSRAPRPPDRAPDAAAASPAPRALDLFPDTPA